MCSDVTILLVDNGSVKPAATLMLRRLAQSLSKQCGQVVHPVSLRHANRIDSEKLEGKPALTLVPFLTGQLQTGHSKFVLIPLFFAQSDAITSFVPEQVKMLQVEFGDIDLTIADVIYPLPGGEERLVTIFYDFIQPLIKKRSVENQNIVLVDHGSPSPKVTEVRQHIAAVLQQKFDRISIEQAVMERREGSEYDFNGPLLEDWLLQKAVQGKRSAIVALMFFLPGRHAGEGGDIEKICSRVQQQYPEFDIQIIPVIASKAELIEILQDRLQAVLTTY